MGCCTCRSKKSASCSAEQARLERLLGLVPDARSACCARCWRRPCPARFTQAVLRSDRAGLHARRSTGAGLHGRRTDERTEVARPGLLTHAMATDGDRARRSAENEQRSERATGDSLGGSQQRGSRRSAPVALGHSTARTCSCTLDCCGRTEKGTAEKTDEIQLKTKGFAPKLCTNEIHLDTNIFSRNHRLGLTQTPEKSDRRHDENGE
jgi:hypothetical protein